MPRASEGWSIRLDPRTGIFCVRFRIDGRRIQRSTGERTKTGAQRAAARIHAEALNVERTHAIAVHSAAPVTMVEPSRREPSPLAEAIEEWLVVAASSLDEATHETYGYYARKLWLPHFRVLDGVTSTAGVAYSRARLAKVRRNTLKKELSALRGFLRWAYDEGLIAHLPEIQSPSRAAAGVAHDAGRRDKVRVDLSEQEVELVLAALPERASQGGFPVRAYFQVMYETSLRRSTLDNLIAPQDYTVGDTTLRIRDEIDKARFGRSVPLSARARAALESVCPKAGAIFGVRRYDRPLELAALAAGLDPFRARHLSTSDFRHARLSHLASRTNNLSGVAYLAGHKHISTTSIYAHPSFAASERLLFALDAANGRGRRRKKQKR